MKIVDYIIVGSGLAGIAFSQTLKQHSKSILVYDDSSQRSSLAAAGMYNPVILKRFTQVWKAKEQLALAMPFYQKLEDDLKFTLKYPLRLLRRFTSIEEQNQWLIASDHPSLEPFMSNKFIPNDVEQISAEFGFGEVLNAGRIDTIALISRYKVFLQEQKWLKQQKFDYTKIQFIDNGIVYDNVQAKHVVFADGFGIKDNPYFNQLPLNGTKGELLTIYAPELKLSAAIKSSVFIIPTNNDHYIIGSTYAWDDHSNTPTTKAKDELITKLKTFLKCNFEIVEHWAGIRPTVPDRRPLVGRHHKHSNLYLLNGLGTRGVMIAPYVANQLYDFIENERPLDATININRFTSL